MQNKQGMNIGKKKKMLKKKQFSFFCFSFYMKEQNKNVKTMTIKFDTFALRIP